MHEITIREAGAADAEAIARVQVESWHTTFRGVLPDDYLAGITFERRAPRWAEAFADESREERVYVAVTAAGEIVGFASGGPERDGDPDFDGELYAIYILEGYQRRGVGRRLTRAVADALAARGCGSVLIWVLEVNAGGRRFYESLGGRPAREARLERDALRLKVIGYGWADIAALRARLA